MNWLTGLYKKRMILSRVLGILGVLVFVSVKSAWDANHPLLAEFIWFVGLLLVGVGVVGRVWSLGYLAGKKGKALVVEGPFSLCRNPLYLFSFIGLLGICLCTEMLSLVLIVMPLFIWMHLRSVRLEECKLRNLFGEHYAVYAKRIPRFIPSFIHFVESEKLVINGVLFRKGVMEVAVFFLVIGVFELVEVFRELGLIPTLIELF